MKRFLLVLQFFCVVMAALAADGTGGNGKHVDTDDHVAVGELTPVAGSTNRYSLMVSLVGSRRYTAGEMDIEFPAGLDVEMKNGKPNLNIWKGAGTIYPYSIDEDSGDRSFTHSIISSFGVIGKHKLRLSIFSTLNENFTADSGPLFKLYLTASPYLKPGEARLKITQCHLITAEKTVVTQYDTKDHDEPINITNHESHVPLLISAANKYSTCVLPFATSLPQGLRAFSVARREKTVLYLEEAESMEAFTPYILYAENGFSGTLSGTVDESLYQETVQRGVLYGTLVDRNMDEGHVLQNKGDGARFYAINGQDFVIPAGKCWVLLDVYNPPVSQALSMEIGGTTGIGNVESQSDSVDAPVYSIDGTRVKSLVPGRIYIRNGRKFMKI